MPKTHKVGVLTFHRCINYGSYWQARALVEGLRLKGYDAELLDHQSPGATRAEWRNAFQPVLPRRTPRLDYRLYAAKARRFFEAVGRLPLSRAFALDAPEGMDRYDVVVVGSDEVWNFRHPWYAACPLFFGQGVKADRLVSYAASFGCHDAGDRLGEPWSAHLKGFSALAVRDENSRELVRRDVGADPALVLDPCLQFDVVCRRRGSAASDVAVVYGHGFPAPFAAAVRRWADTRGLRLVSLGYRNDWADEQALTAGPEGFAKAMGSARAVITNFFHGCVFALVNDKPFVCTPTEYRRHKMADLVRTVGVDDRLVEAADDQQDAVADVLDRPPGEPTRRRLRTLRAHSADYLDHALQ